ncbi:MAG TPA: acetate kinase [Bacteroidales bacterium]|jgi:acetate kinase|nr:acetate kinase [Bacteroidales bacterium]
MKILVLNCGSSSIKYQLLQMNQEEVIAQGMIDRIGEEKSKVKLELANGEKHTTELHIPNHDQGVQYIIDDLCNPQHNIITNKHEIVAVGHRVVHGAEVFSKSTKLTAEVIAQLEKCCELAPLHNPANLKGIYAAQKMLPHAIQCGTFDTAFHQSMPAHAFMYGLPYEYYERLKVRRYGFHGSSHRYVSQQASKLAGKSYDACKTIVCHLGNGSSISAVLNGKSVDTSMGLTPLEGLIMGTRCGDLDLGAALYIMRTDNLSVDEFDTILNKKSGFKGIAGISDMRDMKQAAQQGNERAQLALDMLAYRIKKYIGAYAAAMQGVDCVVFTGGIGENNPDLRKQVCSGLEFMGVYFDEQANTNSQSHEYIISQPSSAITVMVIQTNEEIVIARDTYELITHN